MMFRQILRVSSLLRPITASYFKPARSLIGCDYKSFSTLNQSLVTTYRVQHGSLINNQNILQICDKINVNNVRTVTKFSLKKGKRKTVKAALRRFFRLHWGGWIRPKVGRKKKLWKKSAAQKRRLRQHVFCNATQSNMLDKMVTKFWRRPKYYVEDPYEPYHTREEFTITRRKPVVRN